MARKPTQRQLLDILASRRAGCVKILKSRSTGQYVGLYRSAESGIEVDPDYPWTTVCEDHGGVVKALLMSCAAPLLSSQWARACSASSAGRKQIRPSPK